jgi:hypothetical protein
MPMFLGLPGVLAKAGSIAAGRPLLGCYCGGGQKPPSNLTNIERHQCGYLALEKSLVRSDAGQARAVNRKAED